MDDLDKYSDLLNHDGDGSSSQDDLGQFLQQSSNATLPEGRGKKAIWDAIESELEKDESEKRVSKINPWFAGGIAAAVVAIVAFVLSFQSYTTSEPIHIVAESGKDVLHQLPDGSTANLNASSSIFYNEDWDRSISLSGEAFFKVMEGSTFTVKTPFGEVQVLGTSFNVFARDSIFEVACKTGKVRVYIPEKSITEELTPGDKLFARMDTVFQTKLELEEIGNWTSGEFFFSNRPIREVLDEIERQYQTTIDIRNGDTLRFTGYFFKDADINTTLDLICLPLGLQFEKQDDVYVITELSQEL